jgi:alkyl hydroperoxide reductase subunit AhpC
MGLTINDTFPNLMGDTQDSSDFNLYDYLGDSWGVIFMHPGDYTPVCTTELGEAASKKTQFDERSVKMCGFSCNSAESHRGWIEDIKAATGKDVEFPLFCDPEREKSVELGVLDETNKNAKGLPMTVRSVFILKPDKTVALMLTYPATCGRNFDEILRCVDSLQLTTRESVATPVNWNKGDDVIVNFPLTDADADEKFGKDNYRIVDLPSEKDKELTKHYLRYTKDPSGGAKKAGLFSRFRKK